MNWIVKGWNKVKSVGARVCVGLGFGMAGAGTAMAQTEPDPVADITAGITSATTVFNGVVGLSITAFVVGLVMAFARKGKK